MFLGSGQMDVFPLENIMSDTMHIDLRRCGPFEANMEGSRAGIYHPWCVCVCVIEELVCSVPSRAI